MTATIDNIKYELDAENKTASVCPWTYISDHTVCSYYEGSIIIPSWVVYNDVKFRVVSILKDAFSWSGITAITIGEGVNNIGENSFSHCEDLTMINLPDSIVSIAPNAFDGTRWHYDDQQKGIVYINKLLYAYKGIMPDNTTIVVKDGTISINTAAFSKCVGLTSITIPDSVTNIESFAFSGCTGLTSITIPNGISTIGTGAFSRCSSLSSITIPDSVTNIESFAFSGCTSLTSITIPNDITTIGVYAFAGTPWFDNFPNGVTYIHCVLWRYKGEAPYGTIVEVKEGTKTISPYAFEGSKGLTSITIPNSVTSIGRNAFAGCTSLTSIEIPNSVTSIEYSAFKGCMNLTSITIPDGVTTIGMDAFCDCYSLTSIIIPNSVTSIKDGAFKGCTNLTSITIPEGVTNIGKNVWEGCVNITSIIWCAKKCNPTEWRSENKRYHFYGPFANIIHQVTSFSLGDNVEDIPSYLCNGMRNVTSIIIPNSVMSIGKYVFSGCWNLKSITTPNGEANGWSGIPKGNNELDTIIIPENVATIERNAFDGCKISTIHWTAKNCKSFLSFQSNASKIQSFLFGDAVESIPDGLCNDMIKLSSITIPENVMTINGNPFSGCNDLSLVLVKQNNTKYDSRDDCNAIIETDSDTLIIGCKNTVIPSSVRHIGDNAFANQRELTSLVIPNGVKSIGKYAFRGCSKLISVILPDTLEQIGYGAFFECPALYIHASNDVSSLLDSNGLSYLRDRLKHDASIGDFRYELYKDSALIIHAEGKSSSATLVIQAIVEYNGSTYNITEIAPNAFHDYTNLTSITIPNSVNTIAQDAFRECKQLRSIRIPQGKKSIFYGGDLRALQDKIIEYKESLIGDIQYELDDNLTAIVCAKTDKYAGNIVIPTRVEQDGNTYTVDRIAQGAFMGCYDLTSITLPKSIGKIGKDVFFGCENLQTIRVPQGMTDRFCKMGLEPWRDKIVEPRQEEYTILLNIARGYELGIGMARNLAQAVLCYVQAADKGCAEAAYHLGELYEEGKALPQDDQQAADWFAKASQLYHPNGEARRHACLRRIEEENARLSAFQEEQHAARQAQLAQWAAAQKPQKTILFFDTETNGLPANYKLGISATSNWPRLIQLAWIITDESGNVLKRKSQLIYPQSFTIDADVTRLTGITTADAQRNGIALSDVLSEFIEDVESASLLVGHNVDFDMHIIGCELYRMGMNYSTFINKPSVCTMVRSTNFCAIPSTSHYYSGYKFPSLTELYTKLFGHAFSGAHDALSDITATKDCYFELLRRGII